MKEGGRGVQIEGGRRGRRGVQTEKGWDRSKDQRRGIRGVQIKGGGLEEYRSKEGKERSTN